MEGGGIWKRGRRFSKREPRWADGREAAVSTGAARLILCLTLVRPCLRPSVYFQGAMNGLIVQHDRSEAAGGKSADKSKKIE